MERHEASGEEQQTEAQTAGHVRELFSAMVKTAKAMNLYMGKGASVQRFVSDLVETSNRLFEQIPSFSVDVRPDGFFMGDIPVEQSEEGKQGTAYELFADGIRELKFVQGMDRSELLDFIDVLRTRRPQLVESGQDMVTCFWSKGFSHLQFRAVESFLEEGGEGDLAGAGFDSVWPSEDGEEGFELEAEAAEILADADPEVIVEADVMTRKKTLAIGRLGGEDRNGAADAQLARQLGQAKSQVLHRWMKIWEEALILHRRDAAQQGRLLDLAIGVFMERIQAEDLLGTRLVLAAVTQGDRRLNVRGGIARKFAELVADPQNLQQLMLRSTRWDLEWVRTFLAMVSAMPRERMPAIIDGISAMENPQAREEMLRALAKRGIDVTAYRLEQLSSEDEVDVLRGLAAVAASPDLVEDSLLVGLMSHPSRKVRAGLLKVLPANRTTLDGIAGQLEKTATEADWIEAMLVWIVRNRRPPLLDALLTLVHRLDAEKDSNLLRKVFRVMAGYGPAQVGEHFRRIFAYSGVRRHSEERKLLLLAAMTDDGSREWAELVQPLTRGWLTSRRIQSAATAVLKKLGHQKGRRRGRT